MIYVDTSALLKVVRADEPGADEVRAFVADAGPLVSSRLLAVEMHVAGRRIGLDDLAIRRLLGRVDQVAITEGVIGSHRIAGRPAELGRDPSRHRRPSRGSGVRPAHIRSPYGPGGGARLAGARPARVTG